MPGSKNQKTPVADHRSAAGASAIDRIDLADSLAIGTPDLEPVAMQYKGIPLDLRRYYSPDDVEALVDTGNRLRQISAAGRPGYPDNWTPEQIAAAEAERAKEIEVEVSKCVDGMVALLFPDQRERTEQFVAKLDERSTGEVARIFRAIYTQAGIVNQLGEFLAL